MQCIRVCLFSISQHLVLTEKIFTWFIHEIYIIYCNTSKVAISMQISPVQLCSIFNRWLVMNFRIFFYYQLSKSKVLKAIWYIQFFKRKQFFPSNDHIVIIIKNWTKKLLIIVHVLTVPFRLPCNTSSVDKKYR